MHQNRIHLATNPSPPMSAAPPLHDQDQVVVRIPCYEPSSHQIELTGEDLCRNTLFIGTVGSGKTTSMNPILRDLIAHQATAPERRIGLLIIDSKMDETVEKVRHWAAAAGRLGDLQVLSPTSDFYYDFLHGVNTFEDLDEAVEKICSAYPFEDHDNRYWLEGRKPLLNAALTIMLVTSEGLDFSEVMRFLNGWLMNAGTPDEPVRQRLEKFATLAEAVLDRVGPCAKNKLDSALSTIRMWSSLDPRTKSNWTSVFTNCLSPLVGANAQGYFLKNNRQRIDLDQIVSEGRIVTFSINAARDPALAQLIGRLIKADFYRAAQSRRIAFSDQGRLVGLVMDEYPLVVTGAEGRYGDVVQLQSLRSKRAFVVAATQGLISLDMIIGTPARQALLINFNNLFLLNSHEPQVDAFAQSHFGFAARSVQASVETEDTSPNSADTMGRRKHRIRASFEDWVCPPGRLSQLEGNQAFVSLTRGRKSLEPLWIIPLYFDGAIAGEAPQTEAAAQAMRVIHQARQTLEATNTLKAEARSSWSEFAVNEDQSPSEPWGGEAEPAVESAPPPQAPPPQAVRVVVTEAELEMLTGPAGILTRFQTSNPEEMFRQANTPEPGEHTLFLTAKGITEVLKLRATNKIERTLLQTLRSWRKKQRTLRTTH